MSVLFVTGTDTEVGKTFFCGLFLDFLCRKGISAGYQKWVSTGSNSLPPDLVSCMATAGISPEDTDKTLSVPYSFRFAASPHLAADQEGAVVDPDLIASRYHEARRKYEFLLVEGVGGILVPLNRELLLADLVSRVALPVLIVARSGLGTLNHTLLTIESLRRRKIPILGVVFSDASAEEDEVIVADNMKTIAAMGKVRVFGRMRRYASLDIAKEQFDEIGEKVWDALRRNKDTG